VKGQRSLSDRVFGLSNRVLKVFAPQRARMRNIVRTAEQYDMVEKENERFFLSLYMHFITDRIRRSFGQKGLKILDAGCGQGRLSIALAKEGHDVTGIDLSSSAIDAAKQYALREGAKIRFLGGNLESGLKGLAAESYDCVISTEVLYMVKNYQDVIAELLKLVRPEGLIILSLRSRFFYTLVSMVQGRYEQAERLAIHDDVYLNGETLNCHRVGEMEDLLRGMGVGGIETRGIGVLSGIPGDPQAQFAVPENLNEKEREILYRMEIKMSEEYCRFGRYILLSGVRSDGLKV
jgi:ubiquinone biosynthesis O-methyltransferase